MKSYVITLAVPKSKFSDPRQSKYIIYYSPHGKSHCKVQNVFTYHDVFNLMFWFRLDGYQKLINQIFTVNDDIDSIDALHYFINSIIKDASAHYQGYESIYERAAVALAAMREPDFDSFRKESVLSAFNALFSGFQCNEQWLTKFINLVFEHSRGQVRIDKASCRDFKSGAVKGAAEYLKLISAKETIFFTLKPDIPPIQFDKS